jgi:hypothetical protein
LLLSRYLPGPEGTVRSARHANKATAVANVKKKREMLLQVQIIITDCRRSFADCAGWDASYPCFPSRCIRIKIPPKSQGDRAHIIAQEHFWLFDGYRDRPMLVTFFQSPIPYLAPPVFWCGSRGKGWEVPLIVFENLTRALIFYFKSRLGNHC